MTQTLHARAWLQLLPAVVGMIIGLTALQLWVDGQQTNFDELALGAATTSIFPEVGGQLIHGQDLDTVVPVLDGLAARGNAATVLWLGNSQLHGVNQAAPDATPASAKLHRRLAERNLDLIAFSQPNAAIQEHWVFFEYIRSRVDLQTLILPVVFDDLREIGIRPTLIGALADLQVRASLATVPAGQSILDANANIAKPDGDTDLGGLRDTFQESTEAALNGWLDDNVDVWAGRPEMRGRIFNVLYQLRNRIFGIGAQSVRRLIPGRYALNMLALTALLDSARRDGVDVFMYVVPLRSDVAMPYDPDEYRTFKDELAALAKDKGAGFANFENVVPGEHWGYMGDQQGRGVGLDFMHFQEAGHELLADAIDRTLLGASR